MNNELGVDSAYAFYQAILQKISLDCSGRKYSPSEMLRQVVLYLRREGEYMFLVVDDVDYLVCVLKEKRDEGGVISDPIGLNEMFVGEPQRIVDSVFVAKDASFRNLLDPAEVSSLSSVIIRMPNYSSEQLAEIIMGKVEEVLRPEAVSVEVIEFTADLAASKFYNLGDYRFALDILLTADFMTDSPWSDSVTLDHVRMAAAEWFYGISAEDLAALNAHEIIALLVVARALDFHKTPYVLLKQIIRILSGGV